MQMAAVAARRAADPLDPRQASAWLQAERLAREIIAEALDDAQLIVAAAGQLAAVRERELVERAETVARAQLPPVDTKVSLGVVAAGTARSAAILQRAIDRATRLRLAADAEVAAIEKESRRRRKRLGRELRALERERDRAVRELSARIASVQTAGEVASRRAPTGMPRAGLVGLAVVAVAVVAGIAGHELSTGAAAPSAPPAAAAPSVAPRVCPIPARFRPTFVAAARREHVPLALLTAVAAVESRFDVHARSSRGAIGLMQLTPSAAREVGVDPYRWRANVRGGARYLREMLNRFGANSALAVAAYNAGADTVQSDNIPLETMLYVAAVASKRAAIAGCR